MLNAQAASWNQTYAECSVMVKDIAVMIRLREITPLDVEPGTRTSRYWQLAVSWMQALESMIIMVEDPDFQTKRNSPDLYEMLDFLEVCRDVLLKVRSELLDLLETDDFEVLRQCMFHAAAEACA